MHPQGLPRDRLDATRSPSTVQELHHVRHKALAQAVQWDMLTRKPAAARGHPGPRWRHPGRGGVLLVESKFWARLTPSQPMGYLRRLPEDKEGMGLFVAPEGRYERLWPELVARCRGEGSN